LQKLIFNTVVARALSTALNFCIALLIARHAGPAVKGDVTLLITTVWFLIFFSNILGGQVLVYLIPRNKMELLIIPAYAWSVLIAVAGFMFLKFTHIIHANHIPSIVVLSFFSAIISIHQTVLLARKQITNANILLIIPLFMQLAGVLFCFYFMHISDAYAYIYASLVAYTVTSLMSFLLVKKFIHFGGGLDFFAAKELKASFRFGLLFQLIEILQLLNLRYYFYQLGLQQGSKYLGIFSIGISILEAVWIIPRSVATVHYVHTSHSADVNAEAHRAVRLFKFSFMVSLLALFIIWLVPSQVYTFVFGPGFSDVKHSMRFLLPGILIYSFPLVISSFYFGTGKYRSLIISNIAGFASLVIFSWLLIPRYVMSGAGLAATLSFAVASVILWVMFMADTKIRLADFVPDKNDVQAIKDVIMKRLA
jgi:O-antigen/teichoic acid export membrane protein